MAKTRNGSAKKERETEGGGVTLEVIGIAVLAAGLYCGVSLFSYAEVSNWGGIVGEYLARACFYTIGYVAYVLPFVMVFVSAGLLLRRVFTFRVAVPVCFVVLILSLSSLFAQLFGAEDAGGVIGGFLSGYITAWFGSTGAAIILFAAVLISLLIATGLSLVQFGVWATPFVTGLFRKDEEDEEETEQTPAIEQDDLPEEDVIDEPVAPSVRGAVQSAPKIHARSRPPAAEDEPKERLEFASPKGSFKLPPITLLDAPPEKNDAVDKNELLENARILEKKLLDFGIEGRVLEVMPGPVVTMYEFEPAAGVKVGRITNLSDDLALAMKAETIRVVAPIPGKAVVGIEIPNHRRDIILLREMLESTAFAKSRSRLTLALGKDISGNSYTADFARMPHLLVAGATGTGKSVSVNSMILSILYKATPEDVRFLMVDPKMLELSAYEGIPHLLAPVITDPKRAAGALRSIVSEMGRRYKAMAEKGAKNIDKYNQMLDDAEPEENGEHKRLPLIVVIIDELADLMMTSGKDVEERLVRLSQMARAAGIHLLVATQRPSVDVVTGLIKTNFPARIAFQLPSKTDSRTILDAGGAETLLGQGDMLFLPPGTSKLQRIHGAYVSETEIKNVTDFWKKQGSPAYDKVLIEEAEKEESDNGDDDEGEEFMRRYDEAVAMAHDLEMISTSYIQRRFRIGYNTAARIIERMEREGIVGPPQGSRPREVIKNR
ncbi:MAG: DNA translocase FtsK 4TM domain-containing protein [Deltaproteobacteria bacterium]|nr:DNA translocase FtsK 4TM domain-containing protein [Deltaproteobacteria bacterium]